MENPNLLILDEPVNGLDKDGVADMRKYLLDLKAQGKTVLIGTDVFRSLTRSGRTALASRRTTTII